MAAATRQREPADAYDLLVIGGGINGTGIARDAAGRGLSVLLAERGDLAEFTSSSSTKLIHGGLRYLEYYEFRLVREALAERERLLRLAPARDLAPALRPAPRRGPAPGLDAAARPVPVRPSRAAADAAGLEGGRPAQLALRRAAAEAPDPGLRLFRLLGRGQPPRGAQRHGCPRARRRGPDPHRRRLGPARGRGGRGALDRDPARRARRGRADGPGEGGGQRRRPLGQRDARRHARASTAARRCA